MSRVLCVSSINNKIIRLFQALEGQGWGSYSIEDEFKCCMHVLGFKKPRVVIDIGGNRGDYADIVLTNAPNVRLLVFEPSEVNVKMLEERFEKDKDVTIYQVAVGAEECLGVLYSDFLGSGLASLTKRKELPREIEMVEREIVQVKRLDQIIGDIGLEEDIDILKIDVEGHELDVLKGCGRLLERVRLVQFEFGGCNIDTRTYFRDFWNFFKDRGFTRIYRVSPRGPIRLDSLMLSEEVYLTTNYIAENSRFKQGDVA